MRALLLALAMVCGVLVRRVSGIGAVTELGADFEEKRTQGMWFVKFYAPWCGYCKQLEPIWEEVAREVRESGVTVGRIDATLHQFLASKFSVRGYPTLIFFKGDKQFTYNGSRSKAELVAFVKRLVGPAVETISGVARFFQLRHEKQPFFLYYGEDGYHGVNTPLLDAFVQVANQMQAVAAFKRLHQTEFLPQDMVDSDLEKDSVLVVKGNSFHVYSGTCLSPDHMQACVAGLEDFVNAEKFPDFMHVTQDNMREVANNGGRLLALAAISEDTKDRGSVYVKQWTSDIATNYRNNYQSFHFGYITDPDLLTDLTLETRPFPAFFVYNHTSGEYFIAQAEGSALTQGLIMQTLDRVKSGQYPLSGQDTWGRRFSRSYHELTKALSGLMSGGGLVILLVLAVPCTVVSCLCYMLCTMDVADDSHSERDSDDQPPGDEDGFYHRQRREDELEGLRQRPIHPSQ